MDREQAMICILNFFKSRMKAMSRHETEKVRELIGLHEISASELVNHYIKLVMEKS